MKQKSQKRKKKKQTGSGNSDLHLVRELPDAQRRGLRGARIASVAGFELRRGLAQPHQHPRVGPGLVRVQGGVPEQAAEAAQERHLVPSGRARAPAIQRYAGGHHLR